MSWFATDVVVGRPFCGGTSGLIAGVPHVLSLVRKLRVRLVRFKTLFKYVDDV